MNYMNDAKNDDKQRKEELENDVRKDDAPQLGHFLDYHRHWLQGLELLKSQLDQLKETKKRKPNPHFNTLDMYYYAKLEQSFAKFVDEDYFQSRIANNRFYGLSKEFEVVPYTIPKSHLGLRKYKFMTCPMRVLYYAIGVYLVELSQEYLDDYASHEQIHSRYGGKLNFNRKTGKLDRSLNSILYKKHYKKFGRQVTREIEAGTDRTVVIRLDIENYFDEISIPRLLDLLQERIKPSIRKEMHFDETTQAQLVSFFEFVAGGTSGIPQQSNDVISSFIGHLFLAFGDSFLNDKVLLNNDSIECYSIIRYIDDINISITFNEEPSNPRGEQSLVKLRDKFNALAPCMSDCLYENLGLRLNPKTMIFRLMKADDRELLKQTLKRVSQGIEIPDEGNDEPAPNKLDKIFDALKELKTCNMAPHFQRTRGLNEEEPLKEAYSKRVQDMLEKPEIKSCLTKIFIGNGGFDFELVNADPMPIIILISKCDKVAEAFEEFLLSKKDLTSRDINLTLNYLRQKGFTHNKSLNLLNRDAQMKEIIEIFKSRGLKSKTLGYYGLTDKQTLKITQPNVMEQIRLRVLAEQKREYSVALNHLQNEIHAICDILDKEPRCANHYEAPEVSKFLRRRNVPHQTRTQIRNLFDRRNKSPVSHADPTARAVNKDEYEDYRCNVGKCMKHLLS